MSIYATMLHLDVLEDSAPIVYQGSHVLPSDEDPRGGMLEVALIPSHITDSGDHGPDDDTPRPWLRLSAAERVELNGTAPAMQTVVLDATQVRALRDALSAWFHPPGQEETGEPR